jgi:hypothetical protein
MEIKIEDLKKGDVVLIGASGDLKCVKLLRDVKLAKKPDWRGNTVYSKVLCSFRIIEISAPYTRTYRDYQGNMQTYTNHNNIDRSFGLDEHNHNKEAYVDFNYRKIWLIKRDELC